MKRSSLIPLLLCAVLLLSVLTGCGALSNAAKNAVKNALESAAAEISALPEETPESEESAEPNESTEPEESQEPEETANQSGVKGYWPEDISDTVPKFGYGEYLKDQEGVVNTEDNTVYTMVFAGVQEADMVEYAKALRDKGYDIIDGKMAGEYSIGGQLEKDGASVSSVFMILKMDSGELTYVLTESK